MPFRSALGFNRSFFHEDSSSSDDEVDDCACTGSGFAGERIYQRKIEKMKRLRDKYDWEIEKERRRLLDKLYSLTDDFQGNYPDFRLVFQPDQIHQLVMDSIDYCPDDPPDYFKALRFVEFVCRTGFIDEPTLDQEGKPVSRRITPIHIVARRRIPREALGLDALFAMYNSYDANYTDEAGLTHFHAACVYGLDNVVRKFLESGLSLQVDANLVWPQTGDSPLHLALGSWATWRQPLDRQGEETFRTLLEAGADPNSVNKKGETALHIICQRHCNNSEEVVKMLFEVCDERYRPVQVDTQDKLGNTALLLAVDRDDLKIIELLLKHGASPNLANIEGRTPLHRATAKLSHASVKLLLAHGADLSTFVIPVDSYLTTNGKLAPRINECPYQFKVKLASSLFIIIESLEDKNYELDRSQATSVMKFFSRYGLFTRSEKFPPRAHPFKWYFEERSKEIKIKPDLSLHELVQLSPREAEKLVAYKDYYEFARCSKLFRLKFMEEREACARHLCEKMSKRFFRRWALDPFSDLIHKRLPLEVCEMILAGLANEDLYHICLAAANS